MRRLQPLTPGTKKIWRALLRGGILVPRQSRNPAYNHALLDPALNPVFSIHDTNWKRVQIYGHLLRKRVKKGPGLIINLTTIRSLHGHTWLKREYKALRAVQKLKKEVAKSGITLCDTVKQIPYFKP